MKAVFFVFVMGLGGAVASAQTISLAKAAELACHRVERLVTLKKIDAKFLNQFYALQIQSIPHSGTTDPAFRAIVSQWPGSDGKFHQLEIVMNSAGKADPNVKVIEGSDAVTFPSWPDKDPVTLAENSLHYVLDSVTTKPALKPYFDGMSSLTLSQVKDANGQLLAKAEILSSHTSRVLEVFIRPDGNFSAASQ